MNKLGSIALVISGGILCVVSAPYLMPIRGAVTATEIMLWSFGPASVLLGGLLICIDNEQDLRLLGHKFVDYYKTAAILTLNAVVLCVGLEWIASSSVTLLSVIPSPAEEIIEENQLREKVSYYASQDWAQQYWYEFDLSNRQQYYSFVGWRRAPFKGKTIEIDQNGLRLTPGADCRAASFKVFTFGASEMWGTGSPNWDTIPANLQKGLEQQRHGPVCVMNFAESAYVSMQDLIMLLLQLRVGNLPDLVLFYNIGGDVYSAYQSGRAGVIQNMDQLVAKFERGEDGSTFIDPLKRTYSYALIAKLVNILAIANPDQQETPQRKVVTYESMRIDVEQLSDSVVRHYLENYEIVDALAREYGFKYLFILPPRIFRDAKHLTPEEQEMKRRAERDAALYKLYNRVYQTIEERVTQYPNFHSMSHVFDRYESLIWIDGAHVTPVGNQLIAGKMLDVIQGRSSDEK
jgi:hypothetical protein